jgi:hypothetical protein
MFAFGGKDFLTKMSANDPKRHYVSLYGGSVRPNFRTVQIAAQPEG